MKPGIYMLLIPIAYVLVGAFVFVPLYRLNRMMSGDTPVDASIVVMDTCTVYDTVTIYKPVVRDSVVVRYVTERMPVADDKEADLPAKAVPDSANVVIPITQKVYKDSAYTAYVSGYKPNLDSLVLYKTKATTTIQTIYTPAPKRWSLGLQVGAGVSNKGVYPYLGLGVSYNFASW